MLDMLLEVRAGRDAAPPGSEKERDARQCLDDWASTYIEREKSLKWKKWLRVAEAGKIGVSWTVGLLFGVQF